MNNCEIIKDLLPLYQEDLLSEESKTFVEDHLKTCPECENLLKEEIKIESKNTKPLDFVEKRIKKEARYSTLATIALIGSILIFIMSYLNTPRHIEYDKDLYKVYRNDKIYTVEFSDKVSGIDYTDTEDAIYLDAYSTKYDEIFNKRRLRKSLTFHKDNFKTVLYQNHDSMPNMVIGSGEVHQTLLPRLLLGFYARLSLIGFVGLVLLIFLIEKSRKKAISLPIKTLLIGAPLSLFLAIIAIKGLNTPTYYPMTDFKYIAFLALGIYLFLIFLSIARESKLPA
ncbi:zf-HC2 domain-containing protein [uncultured Anaerococcus sp.]|uniref:zf-HC2 domain-containing protein n=1 Tax=uncultured Anaerococcus sp. TaxID=293428 RepID=UPI00280B967A|nr:zf-HC2 domain-containing protein [uncultured Anaerococcus sp.]